MVRADLPGSDLYRRFWSYSWTDLYIIQTYGTVRVSNVRRQCIHSINSDVSRFYFTRFRELLLSISTKETIIKDQATIR